MKYLKTSVISAALLSTASLAMAGSVIGSGSLGSVSVIPVAQYVYPASLPNPVTTSDASGNTLSLLASNPQNYVGSSNPLVLTYTYTQVGSSNSNNGVDTWTSDNTAGSNGPIEIKQTANTTAVLAGTSGNTQVINLGVAYTPCNSSSPIDLSTCTGASGCALPTSTTTQSACTTSHAAIKYAFVNNSGSILSPDTYTLDPTYALTFQQGF